LTTEYVDQNRVGDHICYISDLRRFQTDYPNWRIVVPLEEILLQFVTPSVRAVTAETC
jgi:CDP-paratose 2-epimerase